ncbi:MAG: DUF1211 domain-containing protein [Clostridia bacterium]|nr:DUF1211 domain-containing protein [Clostridia bacterium]
MKFTENVIARIQSSESERTIVFYDAVMAIAITLMVLELNVTGFRSFNFSSLEELFVPFTALLISFTLLGEVWLFHVKAYSLPHFSENASPQLNLLSLLFVALFPKATSVIAEYNDHFWSVLVYVVCVIGLVGLTALNIRVSLGKVSRELFKASPIPQDDPWRVFPKDMPLVVRTLSTYEELRDTYETLRYYFHLELVAAIMVTATTLGSTIFIMVWYPGCYLFLLANIIFEIIIRSKINKVDTEDFMHELEIFIERVEEVYTKAKDWEDSSGNVDFDAEAAHLSIEENWSGDHARRREERQAKPQSEREAERALREQNRDLRSQAKKLAREQRSRDHAKDRAQARQEKARKKAARKALRNNVRR